jgi:hypothetical protein
MPTMTLDNSNAVSGTELSAVDGQLTEITILWPGRQTYAGYIATWPQRVTSGYR